MAAGLWSLFIACMYNMFCCLIQYCRGSGEVLYDGDYQRKESIGEGGKSQVHNELPSQSWLQVSSDSAPHIVLKKTWLIFVSSVTKRREPDSFPRP